MQNTDINYLVMGAGVTGLSVVSFLRAQGNCVRVMDSRELPPNANKIKALLKPNDICFGEFKWEWLEHTDVLVVSPGIDSHQPPIQTACQRGVKVIGDIELFAQAAERPYIAITGSNGKTTVTTLVTELLQSQGIKAKAGANIGEPALELLSDDNTEIYVLELSSFQLETCHSLRASSAVVLNVSNDHLDRHADIDEYKAIKCSIYKHAQRQIFSRLEDCRQFNQQAIKQQVSEQDSTHTSFGFDKPESGHYGCVSDHQGRQWLACGDEKIMPADQIPLVGEVGKLNVLAALAIAAPYLSDMPSAVETIRAFKGLPHRCQRVAKYNDVTWINDSKATNIGATLAAIEGLERPLILLLGGVHKGGAVECLIPAITNKVRQVIVYGRDADIFRQALAEHVQTEQVQTLQQAVTKAYNTAVADDTVLLSPACASFDSFDNYMHRGDVFSQSVQACMRGSYDAC